MHLAEQRHAAGSLRHPAANHVRAGLQIRCEPPKKCTCDGVLDGLELITFDVHTTSEGCCSKGPDYQDPTNGAGALCE